mgnify:CR=1 FL=1
MDIEWGDRTTITLIPISIKMFGVSEKLVDISRVRLTRCQPKTRVVVEMWMKGVYWHREKMKLAKVHILLTQLEFVEL